VLVSDIKKIASECGMHWKIVEKLIKQAEKRFPEFDWQEDVDWYTHCSEIRDYGDREKELRRRLKLPLETEKEMGIGLEQKREEEIAWLLGTKEGVKELLRRIYKNELTKKQKEELKEKILNRPDLATLIALYDGKEQDYAKRFLAEMVVAPTRKDVKELLKADTLKIKSSRGWIKSINNIPVPSLRSVDIMKDIMDYTLVTSETLPDGTIAIYTRKPALEPVKEILPKEEIKPVEVVSVLPVAKIDELVTKYSYAEVAKMAKEHNIRSGTKMKMVSELIEKKVL